MIFFNLVIVKHTFVFFFICTRVEYLGFTTISKSVSTYDVFLLITFSRYQVQCITKYDIRLVNLFEYRRRVYIEDSVCFMRIHANLFNFLIYFILGEKII